MPTVPLLPIELWIIIFTFKEKIELRDDCTISNEPKQLRSGKLVYNNDSRLNRFMNKISFIVHSVNDNQILKIKKITDVVFQDYYFINENKDLILKHHKTFNNIIIATIDKIYQFRNILFRALENNINILEGMMTVNEINYGLFLVTKCIYFLENYGCIKNIKNCRCNDDPHDRWDGIQVFRCRDFTQYCR